MDKRDHITLAHFALDDSLSRLPSSLEQLPEWNDADRLHHIDGDGAPDPIDRLYHLLQEAQAAVAAADNIKSNIVQEEREAGERCLRNITEVARRLWTWHSSVRKLRVPRGPENLLPIVYANWLLCLRALYLRNVMEDSWKDKEYDARPNILYERPRSFDYVETLLATNGGSIVYDGESRIYQFSVRAWIRSWDAFTRARARTGYTPSAHAYQRALVLQFANLVTEKTNPPSYYDHKVYTTSSSSSSKLPLPGRLSDEFLTRYEMELFYAMRQSNAANEFYQSRQATWFRRSVQWRRDAVKAMGVFISKMASHLQYRTMIIDKVRSNLANRQLLPGDNEIDAFRRNKTISKKARAESDDVLESLRREMHNKIQSLLLKGAYDIFAIWENAVIYENEKEERDDKDTLAWEKAACRRPSSESTAFLVFQICFDTWMKGCKSDFSFASLGFLDDQSLPPPYDQPPASPQALRKYFKKTKKQKAPYFARISHLYAVVGGEAQALWITPHLAEGVAEFLYRARESGQLKEKDIHPELQILLKIVPL